MRRTGLETVNGFFRKWLQRDRERHGRIVKHIEKRQWPRFPSQSQTQWQPATEEHHFRRPAQVQNISQGGIGLLVEEENKPGSLLHIKVPPTPNNPSSTLLTCVVHAAQMREDSWSLGCSFIRELTAEEMQAFLVRHEQNA